MEQFLSPEEGAPRAAVKRLTAALEQQLIEATVNAPDWYAPAVSRFSYGLSFVRASCAPLGTLFTPREWQETCFGATRRPSTWMNSSLSRKRKLCILFASFAAVYG